MMAEKSQHSAARPTAVGHEEQREAEPARGVSAVEPDWTREARSRGEWSPGKALLASIRAYQSARGRSPIARIIRGWAVLRHRFWSVVSGADIPLNSRIAGGLLLPHPNGVVIHPGCEIGPNCLIFQQVTLGADDRGIPRIGGHVDIGAGAKVLGGIRIGDNARIGANAVVLIDVPPGATAVGVPARIASGTGRVSMSGDPSGQRN
jgi:serine O-acetyltransferase